jgi:DNA-binding MarR family transcriptional regulator
MVEETLEQREQQHQRFSSAIRRAFQIEDTRGVELFASLGRILHLSEMLDCQEPGYQDLSLPRWRLMLQLFMAEQLGGSDGLTPTQLSHSHQVSKNTISALLRGLEEQGLVKRELDPKDLRAFHIHLTDTGRQSILNSAPKRIERLNQMLDCLKPDEVDQLFSFLEKLRISLRAQLQKCQGE